MKLSNQQLTQHLQKTLAPIYLISGDEPLLVQESCDEIINAAKQRGYTERDVLSVDRSFDWQQLLTASNTLSLFSEQRIIDLRMNDAKPGKDGGKILQQFAEKPPAQTLLLIRAAKMDAATQKTKWLSSLEKAGVFMQLWPLSADQLPRWLAQRMQTVKLSCTADGLQMLAARIEGNLLAAQQEIEKLALLHPPGTQLSEKDIDDAVVISSRYDIFRLVDACIAGEQQTIYRILNSLKAEGIEAILVLWALARECRMLARIAYQQTQGKALAALLAQERIFERRQAIVKKAIQRGNLRLYEQLLQQAAIIDKMVKGVEAGNVWDALTRLSYRLAGVEL